MNRFPNVFVNIKDLDEDRFMDHLKLKDDYLNNQMNTIIFKFCK